MAEKLDREYVIPLRKEWLKVQRYRRAGRAAKAIKKFIAKHMRVPDRDTDNVKLDNYLNNELWFRGKTNPPSKIKVKATKDGDIVRVELVETPESVKFLKIKQEKIHKPAEKKEEKKEKEEKKTDEEKKEEEKEKLEEKEKGKAVEEENMKLAKQQEKAVKHTTKMKAPEIQRKAISRH